MPREYKCEMKDLKLSLLLTFVTETISRTDEGQPRPKYIFNKCGTNIHFFPLQRFGPSPSPNFKINYKLSLKVKTQDVTCVESRMQIS